MKRISGFAIAFLAMTVPAFAADELRQDHTQFVRALTDDSLRPTFVKATIVDDRNGRKYSGCMKADTLLSAIHIEMDYPFDYVTNKTDKNPAVRLLMLRFDHTYYFKKPLALDALKLDYSEAQLVQARALVKKNGTDLKTWPKGVLNSAQVTAMRKNASLACALVEAGRMVQRSPLTDMIE